MIELAEWAANDRGWELRLQATSPASLHGPRLTAALCSQPARALTSLVVERPHPQDDIRALLALALAHIGPLTSFEWGGSTEVIEAAPINLLFGVGPLTG